VEHLGLKRRVGASRTVGLLEGKSSITAFSEVRVKIPDLKGKNHAFATLNVSKRVTGNAQIFDWKEFARQFEDKGVSFPYLHDSHRYHDELIGTDNPYFLQSFRDVMIGNHGPLARLTLWVGEQLASQTWKMFKILKLPFSHPETSRRLRI